MKIFNGKIKVNETKYSFSDIDIKEAVFFDIETTGFSYHNTILYLIGCIYYDKKDECFSYMQWFGENQEDESKVLLSFFEFLKNFKTIIHFNGQGFDIPYIIGKAKKFNLYFDFNKFESIDLYKEANYIKKFLKTPNLKQKTLEEFFGIKREDIYSGKDLINIYNEYLNYSKKEDLELLLLHNLEDIKGMLYILDILKYRTLLNGDFIVKGLSIDSYKDHQQKESREIIFELLLDLPLTGRISNGNNTFYMSAYGNVAKVKINIYTDELKYFYSNYKDYYYLPEEDRSIHKSIAFYVDKDYRTKAKAANCYSKKSGHFLPQLEEVISPFFKIEYNDKKMYFELTDEFLKDKNMIKSYVSHVIQIIRQI